nr:hypothetical protein [Tanacetum cinerariifolium]
MIWEHHQADNFIFDIFVFKHIIDSEEFLNVFVRIGFGSTIKLVSFDKGQVVTFNGKLICGFRNSNCRTKSQSDNRVSSPHEFIIHWIEVFEGKEEVAEVTDVENWRIDNPWVLRWIVSLIVWNSSISSTKSSIQCSNFFEESVEKSWGKNRPIKAVRSSSYILIDPSLSSSSHVFASLLNDMGTSSGRQLHFRYLCI